MVKENVYSAVAYLRCFSVDKQSIPKDFITGCSARFANSTAIFSFQLSILQIVNIL